MKDAISKDYGDTVEAATYVSGVMVHLWLATMYELMTQRAMRETLRLLESGQEWIRIYDLGCGPGHFTAMLAQRILSEFGHGVQERINLIGLDKSASFLEHAKNINPNRKLLQFQEGDILGWETEFEADIITVSGLIHHFIPEEKSAALNRIMSLLKTGGLVREGARIFMWTLAQRGLRAACRRANSMLHRIEKSVNPSAEQKLFDRGDFKDPLPDFSKMLAEHHLVHRETYDTGRCLILGSAPVLVFQKRC